MVLLTCLAEELTYEIFVEKTWIFYKSGSSEIEDREDKVKFFKNRKLWRSLYQDQPGLWVKKIALSTKNLNIKQLNIYLYSLVFAYLKMQLNILECEGADLS